MMNKTKRYIKLKYNLDNYEISIVAESKETKLNNKNAKIMRKILNKFKPSKINEDTYVYSNFVSIMILFLIERNKIKKTHVNRTKSKKIATSIILSSSIIFAASGLGMSHYHNHKEKNKERISISFEEEEKEETNDLSKEIKPQTEKNTETSESNNDYVEFNYYYEDIKDYYNIIFDNAMKYSDFFNKYAKMYGIDVNLLYAIAAIESSGLQSSANENASAGLFSIENIWENIEFKVYNFDIQDYETIKVDYKRVKTDAEYNTKIGAAIIRDNSDRIFKLNKVPQKEELAFISQTQNNGLTDTLEMLKIANKLNIHWSKTREYIEGGDNQYYEKVFSVITSVLGNGTKITILKTDGTTHTTKLTNDALEIKQSKTYS